MIFMDRVSVNLLVYHVNTVDLWHPLLQIGALYYEHNNFHQLYDTDCQ